MLLDLEICPNDFADVYRTEPRQIKALEGTWCKATEWMLHSTYSVNFLLNATPL